MSQCSPVFATKGDDRVWSYDPVASSLAVMYDESVHRGVLSGVDDLRMGAHGAAFVAEDGDDMQVVLVRTDGSTFPVLQLDEDNSSEITGPRGRLHRARSLHALS